MFKGKSRFEQLDESILRREYGSSLVLAIFILVVLAVLGVYMVTLSGVQAFTPAFAIQGAQAYQAADSGIEWGIYEATTPPGTCATFPPPAGKVLTVGAFKVTVTCSATPFSEGGGNFNSYAITALAARPPPHGPRTPARRRRPGGDGAPRCTALPRPSSPSRSSGRR